MATIGKRTAALYVDRSSRQWIVRDPDGVFWIVPVVAHPWEHRRRLELSQEMELEPVPGHYKYLLELPF